MIRYLQSYDALDLIAGTGAALAIVATIGVIAFDIYYAIQFI